MKENVNKMYWTEESDREMMLHVHTHTYMYL